MCSIGILDPSAPHGHRLLFPTLEPPQGVPMSLSLIPRFDGPGVALDPLPCPAPLPPEAAPSRLSPSPAGMVESQLLLGSRSRHGAESREEQLGGGCGAFPGRAGCRGKRRMDQSRESCSRSHPAVPGQWAAGRLLAGSFPTPGMCLLGSLAGNQQL